LKQKLNDYKLFLLIVVLTILVTLLVKYGLELDKLVYNFNAEQLAKDQLEKLITTQQNGLGWVMLSYL